MVPGLSPSSVSSVQKAGSQQKEGDALISHAVNKDLCNAYALLVGCRCI